MKDFEMIKFCDFLDQQKEYRLADVILGNFNKTAMRKTYHSNDISFDKIVARIHEQCTRDPPCLLVDYTLVAQKVISRIYDGVKTTELDELTANICISLSTEEPEYGTIATRVIISNNHKNTPNTFLDSMSLLYKQSVPIISEELFNISMK